MGAVASLLGMDRTTLTASLKPLERRGLVRVTADPKDRRGRLLRLTGRGMKVLVGAVPTWRRVHRELEGRFKSGGAGRLRRNLAAIS